MANHLVHGRVKLACELPVRLRAHELQLVVCEFGQHASASSLVVSIHDVPQRHRLGAVNLTNPVAVGEVHPDGGARRGVACFSRHVHHVVRDAHHFLFLVRVHERHVVLKPLGVLHQRGHPCAGVEVLDLHDGLVAAGVPERVVVHLHKSVDVIHIALGVLHPVDVVQAPLFEVACFVVRHEVAQRRSLLVVFRVLNGFVEPLHNFGNALAVEASHFVNVLKHLTVCVFFQTAVQPVLHRAAAALVHNALEIGFGLLCGHVGGVKVDGGTFHQPLAAVLLHFLGLHRGVEHHRTQFRVDAVACLRQQVIEVSLAELGKMLRVRVVVVDAVGEPNALQIHFKRLPAHRASVALVTNVNVLQKTADAQVVTVVLVVHDVAAAQASHVQTVHQRLLLVRELVPTWDLVADDFQVRELFCFPHKARVVGGACRGLHRGSGLKIGTGRRWTAAASQERQQGCGARGAAHKRREWSHG